MKHDWAELKRKYIYFKKYAAISLRDFAKAENLCFNGNFIRKTKLWFSEKELKGIQMGYKIEEKLSAQKTEEAALLNDRHTKIYNRFLDLVEKACDGVEKDRDLYQMKTGLSTVAETLRIVQNGKNVLLPN